MTPLWTRAEAEAAAGGRADGDFAATGVSIDTRSLAHGDLFVALSGARDGHDFVAEAFAKGAAAALVSRPVPGGACLVVPDVLRGLEGLAAAARARSRARVVGVTGSVGKTGTKEMLRLALGAQGRVHAADRSFNNHIGVPLTLARLPVAADWAVLEIGMNHAGEIAPLARLARPDVALITTVESVHRENFPSEAAIAFAKAEIFEGMAPGGVAVLNRDNRHFDRLLRRAKRRGVGRVLRFGTGLRCDARLMAAEPAAGGGSAVQARLGGRPVLFRLGAPGRHLALNALGALLCVQALGGDLARAALALAGFRAPEGRGARWRIDLVDAAGDEGALLLLDESYNANPVSVGAALEVLAQAPVEGDVGRIARGRRIAILGDMLELGPDEAALHAGLARHPAMAAADRVHCVGPRMRALHAALPAGRRGVWVESSAALVPQLRRLLDAGDAVMVKGSLGARMGPVAEAVKALGSCRPAEGEDA